VTDLTDVDAAFEQAIPGGFEIRHDEKGVAK
jgi:hypothetical protein